MWQNAIFEKFENFLSVGSVNDVNNIYFVIKDERDEIMLNSKTFSDKFSSESSLASADLEESSEEMLQKLPKPPSFRSLWDLLNSQELVKDTDSSLPRHHKKSSTLTHQKKRNFLQKFLKNLEKSK